LRVGNARGGPCSGEQQAGHRDGFDDGTQRRRSVASSAFMEPPV
jgi:hypothetical protein